MSAKFVAVETVNALGSNQKPFVVFVTGRDDWLVVVIRSGRWLGLILDEFVHLCAIFLQVCGRKAAKGQVGDTITVHVSVWVVGAVMKVLYIITVVVSFKNKSEPGNA